MSDASRSRSAAQALRTCMAPEAATEAVPHASLPARLAAFGYGLLAYALCLATFVYGFGFIGNLFTPTRLDGPAGPLGPALAIDVALLGVFALQHSIMARPWFKRWWTRRVPPTVERSTYVLASALLMFALFAWWRPIGGVVWDLSNPAARAAAWTLYGAGWALLLAATFHIDHFELFGMSQVWHHARGRVAPPIRFVTPGLYRFVRHPLYVGWFLVFWASPTMSSAHLLFAALTTAYILLAIRWEERDLMAAHPEYAGHRQRVPMFIPRLGRPRSGG